MDIDSTGKVVPDSVNPVQTTGITKPPISGADYSSTTSSVGYVGTVRSSNTRSSPFFNALPQNTASALTTQNLFVNFCPGDNSFVKGSASLAYAVGGSGYYSGSSGAWWSTNFIDSNQSSCTMKKGTGTTWAGGPYYSKNTFTGTGDAQYCLTGACTVEGGTIKLVWAVSWGVLTRNAMFDIAVGDGTFYAYAFPIPYSSDGTVNVANLNTSVMANCPPRGAFVMIDLVTKSFVYTMMDGESYQYAVQDASGLAAGKLAGTTNLRSEPASDDQTMLPLTSSLSGMPVFTNGTVSGSGTSPSWSANTTALNQQRSAAWYKWASAYADKNATYNGSSGTTSSATMSTVYSNTSVGMITYSASANTYYGNTAVPALQSNSDCSMYSGYIIPGSATQCVGSIISGLLFVTPYGYKSSAPLAQSAGANMYTLTTANTQTEILQNVQLPSGFVGGFSYDASVGSYGQVTWLSQI